MHFNFKATFRCQIHIWTMRTRLGLETIFKFTANLDLKWWLPNAVHVQIKPMSGVSIGQILRNDLKQLKRETEMKSTWVVLFSLLCPLQGSFPRLLKLSLFSYRLVEHLAEHTIAFSNQEHALKLVIQHGGLVHDVLARLEPTNLQHGDEVKGIESHLA